MYRITRDGFSFLAMGFTGRAAAAWKEAFIAAFGKMERELRRLTVQKLLPDWQEARQLGKTNRRDLTDAVQALCDRFPEMTRFGVMKHLGVLEAANLVVTKKQGREKLHFLNPVPINEIYMRWIGKFEQGRIQALHNLKQALQEKDQ